MTTVRSVYLVPPGDYRSSYEELSEDFRVVVASAEPVGGEVIRAAAPSSADAILFVGSRDPVQRDVRHHPLVAEFGRRCVLYDSRDHVIPFLKGIYPSIERRYHNERRTRGGFYLRYLGHPLAGSFVPPQKPEFLFSFVGAAVTRPLRKRILELRHSRALLRDTSNEPGRGYGQTPETYQSYRQTYLESLASASFALCPRGVGASSMRIFETMQLGRVPVVLSDAWVPPEGPRWADFSIRVPERELAEVPTRLEALEGRAAAMGAKAREEWERWFSPAKAFSTLARWTLDLVDRSGALEHLDGTLARFQLLRPHFLRHVVLSGARRSLRKALGVPS